MFWLLKQSQPLINFEIMKLLFQSLKVENTPKKHWNNNVNWEIAKVQHCIILITTKVVVHVMRYATISCDDATMIDNQSQVSIHAYLLEGFKKLPILLNLKMMVGDGIINNLSNVILNCLPIYGDLTMQMVSNKRVLPFMLAIHCVMHWTNLVMQTFSQQP